MVAKRRVGCSARNTLRTTSSSDKPCGGSLLCDLAGRRRALPDVARADRVARHPALGPLRAPPPWSSRARRASPRRRRDLKGEATSPCAEATLTMRPKRARLHFRQGAARMAWNAAERLTARIASHLSGGKSSIGATCWMPALFTRMSQGPEGPRRALDQASDLRRASTCRRRRAAPERRAPRPGAPAFGPDLPGREAEAVQHHGGAARGQRLGDAEADAGGGSGHDGDAALQLARGRAGSLTRPPGRPGL